MKLGFVGAFGTPAQQVQLAQATEAAGWDGFFTWDAISLGPEPVWDPFTLLGAIAAATQRVQLGALVLAVPRRQPLDLARQALTVDQLSGGRLVLPVGIGVLDDRAFSGVTGRGATPSGLRERADLLDETLAVLDLAATGETFSFEGQHYRFDDVLISPAPTHRPRIPVWPVGVWQAERSLARAARWDGIVVQLRGERAMEDPSPQDVADLVADLTDRRGGPEAMRDFDIVIQGRFAGDDDAHERAVAYQEAGATWWIDGHWEGPDAHFERQIGFVSGGPPRL